MIQIFAFLYLLKTQQIISVKYKYKQGKAVTITGAAFRVMNSCMDLGIEMQWITSIEVKKDQIIVNAEYQEPIQEK